MKIKITLGKLYTFCNLSGIQVESLENDIWAAMRFAAYLIDDIHPNNEKAFLEWLEKEPEELKSKMEAIGEALKDFFHRMGVAPLQQQQHHPPPSGQ